MQGWKPNKKVGPFVMARLRNKNNTLEKKNKAHNEMIRFIKARSWEESEERWVTPLDSISLVDMNAFIVSKSNEERNQKVSVFLLWDV